MEKYKKKPKIDLSNFDLLKLTTDRTPIRLNILKSTIKKFSQSEFNLVIK